MKKNWIFALVLILALVVLCTACSNSNKPAETPAPTEAPAVEATELPAVTAPPAEDNTDDGIVSASENSAPAMVNREDWLASLSEEQRKVEEELVGKTIEELYAAIGEPTKGAEYATSCLVADGEDGLLYYDGFIVSTTRWPNGAELVMGTIN